MTVPTGAGILTAASCPDRVVPQRGLLIQREPSQEIPVLIMRKTKLRCESLEHNNQQAKVTMLTGVRAAKEALAAV